MAGNEAMPREVSYKGVVGTVRKIAFHEGPKVSEVKSGFVLDFLTWYLQQSLFAGSL